MNLKIETLDLVETRERWPREQPFRPALIRSRKEDKRKWVVLSAPFLPGDEPRWAKTEHDEYIRIPLFPYMLSPEGDKALAFMLQLGLSCASYLPARITDLYIVTGVPVELHYDPRTQECAGIRNWVGFAIITE